MSFLTPLFYLFLLSSCGTPLLKKAEKTPKHLSYSEDVLLEFEDIERYESLKKYRESRWQDLKPPAPRPKKKKTHIRRPPVPSSPPPKAKALQVEIDQNLIYFCMKHRKHPRFRNVEKCNAFTQQTLNKCLSRRKQRLDRKVLKCVKKALHLR